MRPLWGFAWLWRRLDRPVVQPVVRTLPLRNWLMSLSETRSISTPTTPRSRCPLSAVWQRALDTARLWGLNMLISWSMGWTYWRRPSEMLTLFDPLLQPLLPSLATPKTLAESFAAGTAKQRDEAFAGLRSNPRSDALSFGMDGIGVYKPCYWRAIARLVATAKLE